MDDKVYGDEDFIYAMALMEEIELRERESKKEVEKEGDE